MKNKMAGIILLVAGMGFAAQAVEIGRSNVNTNLVNGGGWSGGVAPGTNDVAYFLALVTPHQQTL